MFTVCIDTRLISCYFDESTPQPILDFWDSIQKQELHGVILKPIISESVYHLCKNKGKDYAVTKVKSLIHRYSLSVIDLTEDLLFQAGLLKCQNRDILSYNDCFSIAYCLTEKVPFYTTEKKLKSIPHPILQKLKVIPFKWD